MTQAYMYQRKKLCLSYLERHSDWETRRVFCEKALVICEAVKKQHLEKLARHADVVDR